MDIDTMQAGCELDELIAEKVMGLPRAELGGACPKCGGGTRIGTGRAWCSNCTEWIYSPYPEYSTDIAAAWSVVQRSIPRQNFSLYVIGPIWHCFFDLDMDAQNTFVNKFEARADTAPLAICRAALKAIRV